MPCAIKLADVLGGMAVNDVVGLKVLEQSVEIMGGVPELASHLRVSQRRLSDWLERRLPIPWEISVQVAEIVVPVLLTELFARHKT